MYLFELYHHYTKLYESDARDLSLSDRLPTEWTTTEIKTYPRFAKVNLPEPALIDVSIGQVLMGRHSERNFSKAPSLQDLSTLLFFSLGEKDKTYNDGVGKRMYPSAGARFPLEFYVVIFKATSGLDTGVYHYDIDNHSLTCLLKIPTEKLLERKLTTYSYTKEAGFAIVTTTILSRSTLKYGERAYRFTLLEAGAASQNLSLVATALGIGSVIVGGVVDDVWEELLDIDGSYETLLQGIFFG